MEILHIPSPSFRIQVHPQCVFAGSLQASALHFVYAEHRNGIGLWCLLKKNKKNQTDFRWAQRKCALSADGCKNSRRVSNSAHTSSYTARLKHPTVGTRRRTHFRREGEYRIVKTKKLKHFPPSDSYTQYISPVTRMFIECILHLYALFSHIWRWRFTHLLMIKCVLSKM